MQTYKNGDDSIFIKILCIIYGLKMNIKNNIPLLIASSMLLMPSVSYSIPLNATAEGNSWRCNTGFKKQGQQCNRIFVPPNAALAGTGWVCNTGYKLQGSQCNAISSDSVSSELSEPNDFTEESHSQTSNEDLQLAENYYSEGEYAEALPLFKRLANGRNGRAQLHLASMYKSGQGVLTDKKRAASYYLKAARHGYHQAQKNIGAMYSNGDGMPQDHKQAAYWFEKAAVQGDAESQYNLGSYYDNGTAGVKSYKQAAHWYGKSAGQGNISAQYLFGLYSCLGKGVAKNLKQCALWTKKAHESGHADASQVWDKYKLWEQL